MDLSTDYVISIKRLSNASGVTTMNVNGSSSPQEFYYSPVDKDILVCSLTFLMEDPGTNSFSTFGAITALSNGIDLQAVISGKIYNLMNVKNNAHIMTQFDQVYNGNGSTDTLGNPSGFGDSVNWIQAILNFDPARLPLSGSDRIRAVIRDNLTNIATLAMSLKTLEAK